MVKSRVLSLSLVFAAAVLADTSFRAGEWDVAFAAEGQSLRLTHRESGTEVVGELAFTGPDQATDAKSDPVREWKIVDSRDGAPRRLAVLDKGGNAQGYQIGRAHV